MDIYSGRLPIMAVTEAEAASFQANHQTNILGGVYARQDVLALPNLRPLHMSSLGGHSYQYICSRNDVISNTEIAAEWQAELVKAGKPPQAITIKTAPLDGRAYLDVSISYDDQEGGLTSAAEQAYNALFFCLGKLGMQGVRIWNYLPHINDGANEGNGAQEIYKQFNAGRYAAWVHNDPTMDQVCAATGIGDFNIHNEISITCLASTYPIIHLDNPRQIPFLSYDRQRFGIWPCSRRGTLHCSPDGVEVYIAGTASIIGQDNRHCGDASEPKDIRKQVEVTLGNMETVMSYANLADHVKKSADGISVDLPHLGIDDMYALRVYIRNAADYPIIKDVLEQEAGISSDRIMYLRADICRKPLDVEIEAIALAQHKYLINGDNV